MQPCRYLKSMALGRRSHSFAERRTDICKPLRDVGAEHAVGEERRQGTRKALTENRSRVRERRIRKLRDATDAEMSGDTLTGAYHTRDITGNTLHDLSQI